MRDWWKNERKCGLEFVAFTQGKRNDTSRLSLVQTPIRNSLMKRAEFDPKEFDVSIPRQDFRNTC